MYFFFQILIFTYAIISFVFALFSICASVFLLFLNFADVIELCELARLEDILLSLLVCKDLRLFSRIDLTSCVSSEVFIHLLGHLVDDRDSFCEVGSEKVEFFGGTCNVEDLLSTTFVGGSELVFADLSSVTLACSFATGIFVKAAHNC